MVLMKRKYVIMACAITMIIMFFANILYAQSDETKNILKQGLLGAGTGAIAAGASGGKAGQGALIGAGTSVIGGALLDAITTPSQPAPRRVYRPAPMPQQIQQPVSIQQYEEDTSAGRKKVIRKYDDTGKVISEEEIYY